MFTGRLASHERREKGGKKSQTLKFPLSIWTLIRKTLGI